MDAGRKEKFSEKEAKYAITSQGDPLWPDEGRLYLGGKNSELSSNGRSTKESFLQKPILIEKQ